VIPYWRGRSLRERLFAALPKEWHALYEAGLFTEFMEQRAPGHTVLDDKIYRRGLLEFRADIAAVLATLDYRKDPEAWAKREELRAMDIACDAVPLRRAPRGGPPRRRPTDRAARRAELEGSRASAGSRHAPRDFTGAPVYWFCHLG
jgi:formate C-acetyltransferase